MHAEWLDLTLATPEENLALDEALLESRARDESSAPALRVWTSDRYFVVLGRSRRVDKEVRREVCEARGVPILRRVSGGGTVVQGPGCLSYALVAREEAHPGLANVTSTNELVLERHRAVLERLGASAAARAGITDLTVAGRKVSGNAQRRSGGGVLYHGTFLLDFDIDVLDELLRLPTERPEYRGARGNRDFAANLDVADEVVKRALREAWGAEREMAEPERAIERARALAKENYASAEWNLGR